MTHQLLQAFCMRRPPVHRENDIPLGVATAGMCVLEPPCAAYLLPTFFTPWVSNMFLNECVSRRRSKELNCGRMTYSMGATLLVDLGNRNTAAPTAPAPMAILRGVKAGMLEVVLMLIFEQYRYGKANIEEETQSSRF